MKFCCSRKKCIKKESSLITCHFSPNNALHQKFTFPKDVIQYFLKNPKLPPKLYFKLYLICKYFFISLKIIPCWCLEINSQNEVSCCFENSKILFHRNALFSNEFSFKVFESFRIFDNYKGFDYFLSQKFTSNIISFSFFSIKLSLKELKLLPETIKCVDLTYCTLEDPNNGQVIPLEEIFKCFPNVIEFYFHTLFTNYYTPDTSENLAKIKRTSKLEYFSLGNLPETWDFENFAKFIVNTLKGWNLQEWDKTRSEYNLKFIYTVHESFKKRTRNKLRKMIYAEMKNLPCSHKKLIMPYLNIN